MHEEGIIDQLRQNWVRVRDASTCNDDNGGVRGGRRVEAGPENVVTLFALWAAGVAAAAAVWAGEKAAGRVCGGAGNEEDEVKRFFVEKFLFLYVLL